MLNEHTIYTVGDPRGRGLGGLIPPSFFACQYMGIPADLDLNPPPPRRIPAQTPSPSKNS